MKITSHRARPIVVSAILKSSCRVFIDHSCSDSPGKQLLAVDRLHTIFRGIDAYSAIAIARRLADDYDIRPHSVRTARRRAP